ncbi:MAG: LysR family transcriptional regulator [Gemmatimonadetes bacterium]|nr:LysR family transcriptional regulator [Gemmatimonadota bacterium]
MTRESLRLNYHHLHYFWAVAKEGNLTRAARRLRIAQSALSTQIRRLEAQLGQPLFTRQGRTLVLTEAGRIALGYADTIMGAGDELVATLRGGRRQERQVLRVGAVATLSRNFQRGFLAPLVGEDGVELVLHSGSLGELLPRLGAHTLDLVLSNRRVQEDAQNAWRCRLIARQRVSLVGPRRKGRPFRFPDDLANVPLVLPSRDSEIRTAFDVICEQYGLRVNIAAEVDDMAMLRLLARDSAAVALVPAVVVVDELRAGTLEEYATVPHLHEEFYAISVRRQFQHPLLKPLLERAAGKVLAVAE